MSRSTKKSQVEPINDSNEIVTSEPKTVRKSTKKVSAKTVIPETVIPETVISETVIPKKVEMVVTSIPSEPTIWEFNKIQILIITNIINLWIIRVEKTIIRLSFLSTNKILNK